MPKMVLITNHAGEEYAVLPNDFERWLDDQYKGFRITAYEDGTKYEGPKTAAAIAKADEPAPRKGADKKDD